VQVSYDEGVAIRIGPQSCAAAGISAGRILNGAKPANLPIEQADKPLASFVDTIACCVGYAAPVVANHPIEYRAPFGQPLERADLVSAHKAAVALDIRCEDCDEASADFRRV